MNLASTSPDCKLLFFITLLYSHCCSYLPEVVCCIELKFHKEFGSPTNWSVGHTTQLKKFFQKKLLQEPSTGISEVLVNNVGSDLATPTLFC